MENDREDEKIMFSTQSFCKIGNEIWFVPRNFNALFRMSCADRRLIYVLEFEMEPRAKQNLVKGMVHYGNELWFLPSEAERIYILNLGDKQMQSLELPAEYQGNKYKTGAYCADGKYIWVLPFGTVHGFQIDMQEKSTELLPKMSYAENWKASYMYCAKLAHKIAAVDNNSGKLMCYDSYLKTADFIVMNKKKGMAQECLVLSYCDCFYLFSAEKAYLFDSELKLLEKKSLIAETREMDVLDCLADGDDIWLSCYPDFILRWNLKDDKVIKFQLEHCQQVRSAAVLGEIGCGVLFQDEEKIYCLPGDYGYFIEINKKTQEKREFPFGKEFDWIYEYLAADIRNQEARYLFFNSCVYTLKQYFRCMKQDTALKRNERQSEKNLRQTGGEVGKAIVDEIISEMF